MVENGRHTYIDHLLALNSYSISNLHSWLPTEIYTPLRICQWTQLLRSHPDQEYFSYICQGISSGFRIGFDRSHIIHSASGNLSSSNESVIKDYLEREVALSRMWKFPWKISAPGTQISPLSVIPKNKPGKCRLIMDLSSPQGASINDGETSSIKYATIDYLASLVLLHGRGSLLVKADIQEAY